jgi:hypothetical protein
MGTRAKLRMIDMVSILLLSAATAAAAETPNGRRGPLSLPDVQLLAQPRLTLGAETPDTLGRGRSACQLTLAWGNSFSWNQDRQGEQPVDRRFLIDGEALTLLATFDRGLTDAIDVGVELPIHWRGGGALDPLIDAWHRLTRPLGIIDAGRPVFRRNAFRVEGLSREARAFSWEDQAGAGIGNLRLRLRWRAGGTRNGRTAAVLAQIGLPTATGPFQVGGLSGGVQLLGGQRLAERWDLYAGAGASGWTERTVEEVEYVSGRASGFVAVEWSPGHSWSLVAQGHLASRLIDKRAIDLYPGTHFLVSLVARVDLAPRHELLLALTENLFQHQTTADITLHFGWRLRLD